MKTLRTLVLLPAFLLGAAASALADPAVDVYENPACPCCKDWVSHMNANGFKVKVHYVDNINVSRSKLGMPEKYGSCHTAVVDGYLIEGHVPAQDVKRLLAERPKAIGLAVPGMVTGSPGMEGPNPQPYETLLVKQDGNASLFARHRGVSR